MTSPTLRELVDRVPHGGCQCPRGFLSSHHGEEPCPTCLRCAFDRYLAQPVGELGEMVKRWREYQDECGPDCPVHGECAAELEQWLLARQTEPFWNDGRIKSLTVEFRDGKGFCLEGPSHQLRMEKAVQMLCTPEGDQAEPERPQPIMQQQAQTEPVVVALVEQVARWVGTRDEGDLKQFSAAIAQVLAAHGPPALSEEQVNQALTQNEFTWPAKWVAELTAALNAALRKGGRP